MIAEATLAPAAIAPRSTAPASGLALVDQLLRDRPAVLARIWTGEDLVPLVRTAAIVIVFAAAVFGAALGSFRGGVQIAYAAAKLPIVLLATAALCAPGLTALGRAFGRPAGLTRDLALVMTALALGALTLVALAPLVLVARSVELSYHSTILLTVAIAAIAATVSVAMLAAGVRAVERRDARSVIAILLCVFAMTGAQVTWTLRPYLVRPRTTEVPFVRAVEGSLYESITGSLDTLLTPMTESDHERD